MERRRVPRDLALKVLFQVDVGHLPLDEVLSLAYEEVPSTPHDREFVEETVRGVLTEQALLDRIIDDLAEGWRVERLANVDKNVLRMALWELRHRAELPKGLVIEHAVELARKYSTDESPRFVNGILGAYVRSRQDATPSA